MRTLKMEKLIGIVLVLGILMSAAIVAMAGSKTTKYAAGTTSATALFGPNVYGQLTVLSCNATTDKEDGVVKFYARGSAGKTAPTEEEVLSETEINIANASWNAAAGYTTNDMVVYVHANGTCDYRTVSAATATNVTLSSGISVAGASGDYLYEVTLQGEIIVGFDGAGVGTNDTINAQNCFATPNDSPLYCVLDGTSNAVLTVTVED